MPKPLVDGNRVVSHPSRAKQIVGAVMGTVGLAGVVVIASTSENSSGAMMFFGCLIPIGIGMAVTTERIEIDLGFGTYRLRRGLKSSTGAIDEIESVSVKSEIVSGERSQSRVSGVYLQWHDQANRPFRLDQFTDYDIQRDQGRAQAFERAAEYQEALGMKAVPIQATGNGLGPVAPPDPRVAAIGRFAVIGCLILWIGMAVTMMVVANTWIRNRPIQNGSDGAGFFLLWNAMLGIFILCGIAGIVYFVRKKP